MKINDLKNFQKKENGDLEVQIIDATTRMKCEAIFVNSALYAVRKM